MAAPRFLNLISGRIKQVVALIVSTGASDGEKIVATDTTGKLHDSVMGAATTGTSVVVKTLPDGTLDPSIMPTGIGADVKILPASEALAAGDLVNIWTDSGTAKVRKADATAEGKEAVGFVKAAVALNGSASIYMEGRISGLTGLTAGTRMYLSASTPGQATATAPSTAGNVVQWIGDAVSTTEIDFEKANPVTVA